MVRCIILQMVIIKNCCGSPTFGAQEWLHLCPKRSLYGNTWNNGTIISIFIILNMSPHHPQISPLHCRHEAYASSCSLPHHLLQQKLYLGRTVHICEPSSAATGVKINNFFSNRVLGFGGKWRKRYTGTCWDHTSTSNAVNVHLPSKRKSGNRWWRTSVT